MCVKYNKSFKHIITASENSVSESTYPYVSSLTVVIPIESARNIVCQNPEKVSDLM